MLSKTLVRSTRGACVSRAAVRLARQPRTTSSSTTQAIRSRPSVRSSRQMKLQLRPFMTSGLRKSPTEAAPAATTAQGAVAPAALYRCPETGDVLALPRKFRELSNESLSQMAVQGVFGARKERVLREIMRVDGVSWADAKVKLQEMNEMNDQNAWVATMPYKVGVLTGIVGGIISVPMVFSKDMALWFNENFVGEALPEDGIEEGLATIFKVGNWTWNWMEPPLGTASFVLLGFQMARIHMNNLGWKPYTEWILDRRAERLSKAFPQYEAGIVKDFSRSDPWKS